MLFDNQHLLSCYGVVETLTFQAEFQHHPWGKAHINELKIMSDPQIESYPVNTYKWATISPPAKHH